MADHFVAGKLREWGLGHCQEDFRVKGVRKEALCLLSEDDVNELIPVLGDRLIFKHYLKLFQQSNNNDSDTLPLNLDQTPSTSGTIQLQPIQLQPIPNPTPVSSYSTNTEALRAVVKKTKYGVALLQLKRRLRLKERRRISDFIVNLHTGGDNDIKILPSEFKEWAEQLSNIFPKDPASLWYAPRHKVANVTIVANGARLGAYYGARREISEMNDDFDDDEDEEDTDDVEPIPENIAEDIDWLKIHLEPWCTVTEKWQSTADVTEYLDSFKCLRQPTGHLLIQADFAYLYEDKSTKLFDNVEAFTTKVFEELKTVRPCPRELKAILKQQELTIKTGGKLSSTIIFMALSYLVPVHTVSKKKKTNAAEEIKGWRPNRKEVQDGFITHIDDVAKLQEIVNRRDRKFLDVKQTRQPFVVIVGRDQESITASYVCVNDFFYLMNSPLEALDICFKTIFALGLKYSIESRPLWMLLQTSVYDIYTSHDKLSATASTVSLLARFNIKPSVVYLSCPSVMNPMLLFFSLFV